MNFTASLELCKEHILRILAEERSTLEPPIVSRMISMLILNNRPQFGPQGPLLFESSPFPWNPKVFVNAVRQLAPTLSWPDVLTQLDQPLFNVRHKHALQLITQIFFEAFEGVPERMGLLAQNLYRIWVVNKGGQVCSAKSLAPQKP